MKIFKGTGDFFTLDIGTRSLRVVQLAQQSGGAWSLLHMGYMAVDPKHIEADSDESRRKLGQAIRAVVTEAGISATDCVVGLKSSKTFTTMLPLPKMSPAERESLLKYQADKYIPMPLDDVKLDSAVVGDSPEDPSKDEVLLASVAQEYVENVVDMIDSLGFNVIAAEPEPIAIIRSVVPDGATGGRMVIDIGERSTDIAITIDGSPRLVRTLPMGMHMLVRSISQSLSTKDDQAQQFLLKFGLDKERLEGQVYQALQAPLDGFVSELVKSVKFLQTRYPAMTIEVVHTVGYAATIPLMSEFIAEKANIPVQITSPWQKVTMSEKQRAAIVATEYEFATAVGLAQRIIK